MISLNNLEAGVRALVRTGRHGRTAIKWSEPFEVELHLQKDLSGRACVLALKGHDFAEFDPRHDGESCDLFTTEDYALEILRVPLEG
jgi:hypothetical protein